jgi:membrane-associated phospholipid phosphatase
LELTSVMNIIQIDIAIFEWVNNNLSSMLFDMVLPWMREPYFWLPLYTFIIAFVFFNYGAKAYWFVLFLVLTAGSADLISSRVVKNSIKRLRPCNTENVIVTERVHCGSGYSFTSSHAANHFAVATFLVMTFGQHFKKIKPYCWTWAAIIGFSQIYVGVHFPLDILGGAILGLIIGQIWAILFARYYGHVLDKYCVQYAD